MAVVSSICIVRLSALGDVLMLVPLVRTLLDYQPNSLKITWIISSPAYDLVKGIAGIEFIVIKKMKTVMDLWRFKQKMRNRYFDVLIAAQASLSANLLYPMIHAHQKVGYDRLRAKDGHWLFVNKTIPPGNDHTLEGFLKFAKVLGIASGEPYWDLPINPKDEHWARKHLPSNLEKILLINPAASKPERSWLVERYIALIHEVQHRLGMVVVLIGGPSTHDRYLADQIIQKTDCIDLVGKTNLGQLLAIIKLARLVICPDTGPSHMAVAVGTPVIALHAVTSSQVSGPYIYQHLAVDCYAEAVERIFFKKHSHKKWVWGTHVHGLEAMRLITVEQVLNKIHEALR